MGKYKHEISARKGKQKETKSPGAFRATFSLTDGSSNQQGSASREGCVGGKKVERNSCMNACKIKALGTAEQKCLASVH